MRRPALLAGLILLAGVGLVPRLTTAPGKPAPLLAFTATRADADLAVEAPGLVEAEREEDLVVPDELSGDATIEWLAQPGASVDKGALVVSLSTFDTIRDVREAQESLAEKRADLARQEREDALKIAEARDASRQKDANLAAARDLLELLLRGPDPVTVEKLELQIRSAKLELADLERKSGIQAALKRKGYASAVQAREAEDSRAHKSLELEKSANLLAKEREGAAPEELRKQRLAVAKAEQESALARQDVQERSAVLALERQKKELEIRSGEEALARKERARDSSKLLAPFAGTVVHKGNLWGGEPFRVGSSVWSGVAIAKVVRMDRPKGRVLVGERAVDRVKTGMLADVRVGANPFHVYQARVLGIAGVPKPRDPSDASGAKEFEVQIGFGTDAADLKPNLPLRASLRVSHLTGVFRVPKETVFEDATAKTLTVHSRSRGTVRVEAADEDQDWYYLKAGLEEGEKLAYE